MTDVRGHLKIDGIASVGTIARSPPACDVPEVAKLAGFFLVSDLAHVPDLTPVASLRYITDFAHVLNFGRVAHLGNVADFARSAAVSDLPNFPDLAVLMPVEAVRHVRLAFRRGGRCDEQDQGHGNKLPRCTVASTCLPVCHILLRSALLV